MFVCCSLFVLLSSVNCYLRIYSLQTKSTIEESAFSAIPDFVSAKPGHHVANTDSCREIAEKMRVAKPQPYGKSPIARNLFLPLPPKPKARVTWKPCYLRSNKKPTQNQGSLQNLKVATAGCLRLWLFSALCLCFLRSWTQDLEIKKAETRKSQL